jgi:hypothetical protein
MTDISIRAPQASWQFSNIVISVLTGAVIVLAGVLSFAPYALI